LAGQGKCGEKGVLPVTISRPVLCAVVLLFSSLISLSFTSPAQVQIPKGDVYLGLSRTGAGTFYSNVGELKGWEGAMHIELHRPFIGIEGDLSHYGLGADSSVPRTTAFIFGPRITLGALGLKVFAHAMVGGEHSANSGGSTAISSTPLAYALDGGLDGPIAPFFARRVDGDYIHAAGNSGGTPARFGTGLVFRF
jgi:hypothetical protein